MTIAMLDEADMEPEREAPLEMLESYFLAHGWTCDRHDEEITATIKGSWTEYELLEMRTTLPEPNAST